MSLRKEFEEFKDNALSYIQKNQKRLNDFDIDFACHDHRQISELQKQIEKLQQQVQCGVQGHQFKLVNVYDCSFGELNWYGVFNCEHCKIQRDRKLTQKEIESAKKLGFIK